MDIGDHYWGLYGDHYRDPFPHSLQSREHAGVSKNRGPQYSTLDSGILIIRTPNKVPLIFGNSHITADRRVCVGFWVLAACAGGDPGLSLLQQPGPKKFKLS